MTSDYIQEKTKYLIDTKIVIIKTINNQVNDLTLISEYDENELYTGLQSITFRYYYYQIIDNNVLSDLSKTIYFEFRANQLFKKCILPSILESIIFANNFNQEADRYELLNILFMMIDIPKKTKNILCSFLLNSRNFQTNNQYGKNQLIYS